MRQTPTSSAQSSEYLNIPSWCLVSAVGPVMREECAGSLEVLIKQVTHESIFVHFFIKNSREHDNA